jgi:hypothetical protein
MMAVTVYGWAAALMPGAGESRRNLGFALPGSLRLWLRAALPGPAGLPWRPRAGPGGAIMMMPCRAEQAQFIGFLLKLIATSFQKQ